MAVVRAGVPPLARFVVISPTGRILSYLDQRATDRFVFATLNGPLTIRGRAASDDPEINIAHTDGDPFLHHNSRRLLYFRREGGNPPWRIRGATILQMLEDEGADAPTSSFVGYDPWQYLYSRPCRANDGSLPGAAGITFTGARGSEIAVDLLENTITADGEVGIKIDLANVQATDLLPPFKIDPGMSVGEAWDQLVDTGTIDILLDPIYEPITDPTMLCSLRIRSFAGSIRNDTIFGWDRMGNSVARLSRMIDGTKLANHARVFAGQGGPAAAEETDATSIAKYGEYWWQQHFPGRETNTALLDLYALAQIVLRRDGLRVIGFDPAPERSPDPFTEYGLGDRVPVWSSRNFRDPLEPDLTSLAGVGYQRVYGIPVEIRDDGVEQVRGLVTSEDSLI